MAGAGSAVRPPVDGRVSILAGCLSRAAGLGNTGLWAMCADGVAAMECKAQEGTREDAGMWAS